MPLSTYPVLAWGSAEDINGAGWSNNGTPGMTTGVADPFGGTGAVTINDDDAVVLEARLRATVAIAEDRLVWTPCIKQGSSSTSHLQVRDSTASDYPVTLAVTWSGGVPTVTPGSTGGNPTPTVVAVISLGGGWWLLIITCPWTVNNLARAELYGTGNTASLTGSTSYFLRNLVALDLIDNASAFRRPAPGFRTHRNGAGVRESWKPGADIPIFAGRLRHMPQIPDAEPGKSGWYGENPAIAINCGVLALLTAGWDSQTLRFVKDRSNCAGGVDAYLIAPGAGFRPDFERSWQYSFDLELETASLVTGV